MAEIMILEKVYFEPGSVRLKPDANALLDELKKITDQYPTMYLDVVGNTDKRECARAACEALSQKRAHAVIEALAKRGVPRERLREKAMGFAAQIGEDSDAEGRAKNRRVEFVAGTKDGPGFSL
jgi:OOP family OmpA-OmpF porin